MSLTNAVSLFLHEIASNFRGALAQYGDIIGRKNIFGKGGSRERGESMLVLRYAFSLKFHVFIDLGGGKRTRSGKTAPSWPGMVSTAAQLVSGHSPILMR